ncbi:hypothetical protein BFS30_01430 [Pedobacter steynii]|uniref:Uncharacterized protein n=1 Tax=Pedobacter steynii TaxID=430522 RepID=A0A1D7QB71_9SPHI|nr:hypothetical protein BFS30_01430 [Pedobacter steynii]
MAADQLQVLLVMQLLAELLLVPLQNNAFVQFLQKFNLLMMWKDQLSLGLWAQRLIQQSHR